MSFGSNINSDTLKKYLNKMAIGCRCSGCKAKAVGHPTGPINKIVGANGPSGSSAKKCSGSCGCDSSTECKDCSCKKKSDKPNSETLQDDGCFCRKCNYFLPMVEPDDQGDGKTVCYNCKNPW